MHSQILLHGETKSPVSDMVPHRRDSKEIVFHFLFYTLIRFRRTVCGERFQFREFGYKGFEKTAGKENGRSFTYEYIVRYLL